MLHIGGGLDVLQTTSVATGLPFAPVLLFKVWSLHRALHEELDLLEAHDGADHFRNRHGSLIDHVNREAEESGEPKDATVSLPPRP